MLQNLHFLWKCVQRIILLYGTHTLPASRVPSSRIHMRKARTQRLLFIWEMQECRRKKRHTPSNGSLHLIKSTLVTSPHRPLTSLFESQKDLRRRKKTAVRKVYPSSQLILTVPFSEPSKTASFAVRPIVANHLLTTVKPIHYCKTDGKIHQ